MRRLTIKFSIGLLSLVVFLPATAQDFNSETGEAEARRYTVEVIVFRYAQSVSAGGEVFPPDDPELDPETLPEGQPRLRPDIGLQLLDKKDYKLGEIMGRLRRLDVYDPVMHFGWTQATWPQDQTAAIPLHRFARPPLELDGELTLYLGRYLHLIVDLQLDARSGAAPVFYRLKENRILKNGELRYYDHPKFGVLAMVTPAEEYGEDLGDGELLGYGPE